MPRRFQLIDATDLAAELDAPRVPVVLDVRDAADFELGRIPGSRHVQVHALGASRARLPANLAERIVVVADDELAAHAAANFLVLVGYGDVAVLDGGISAWPGPVDREPPPEPDGPGPQLRTID